VQGAILDLMKRFTYSAKKGSLEGGNLKGAFG
jgi:hypothetical protein